MPQNQHETLKRTKSKRTRSQIKQKNNDLCKYRIQLPGKGNEIQNKIDQKSQNAALIDATGKHLLQNLTID